MKCTSLTIAAERKKASDNSYFDGYRYPANQVVPLGNKLVLKKGGLTKF